MPLYRVVAQRLFEQAEGLQVLGGASGDEPGAPAAPAEVERQRPEPRRAGRCRGTAAPAGGRGRAGRSRSTAMRRDRRARERRPAADGPRRRRCRRRCRGSARAAGRRAAGRRDRRRRNAGRSRPGGAGAGPLRKGAARKTGHYGPFVAHRRRYASLPKEILPGDLTLEQALALLDHQEPLRRGGGMRDGVGVRMRRSARADPR